MISDISPEERLLHLIKGKRKGLFGSGGITGPEAEKGKEVTEKVAPDKEEKKAGERPSSEEKPPKRIEPKPSKRFKTGFPKKQTVSFFVIFLVLAAGAIFLLWLVISLFSSPFHKEKQELQSLEALIASISKTTEEKTPGPERTEGPSQEKLSPESNEPEPGPSFTEYQKLLTEKNIFTPPVKEGEKPLVPEGPPLRELVKDLRLVGIIPGAEPQAIIEDKKNGQTLFVKKGEQIEGIEIKQIQEGRVVLGLGEETIILSL